jgi:hypothetical protein
MAMPTRSCAPGQLCVDHNNVTALNCAVNSYYFGLDLMCLTFESEKNNRGIESTTPVTLTTDTTCVSFLVTNIVASNCVRSPTHLQETGLRMHELASWESSVGVTADDFYHACILLDNRSWDRRRHTQHSLLTDDVQLLAPRDSCC